MLSNANHRRRLTLAPLALACALLAACGSGSRPPAAPTPRLGPESIFQAPEQLQADPVGTLAQLRRLGVERVRVIVPWCSLAPDPLSTSRPGGIDLSDPAAYPAGAWGIYDTIVRYAQADGIGVDFTLTGPAPLWATDAGEPPGGPPGVWKPSPSAFGAFVHAIATRYGGAYKPAGYAQALPRVDFWAIWNEPNYGIDLAPQAVDQSRVEVSPMLYRGLLDAAWSALEQTGHGSDTILIGELAPRGVTVGDSPGNFSGMVPLRFLRALYCVNASYHPLTGIQASLRGCPSGGAGFQTAHPGLFHASGFADHPYPQGVPPTQVTQDEPDYADLAVINRLESTLDRLQATYGSRTRFPIYDTEFGYQTNPPEAITRAISPQLAAYYLNWSEYLHWLDPRIRSYDQYLLTDPPKGNFPTGLLFASGTPKATYYAYRMPLYLPVTSTGSGSALEIWGCVRPAHATQQQTGLAQRALIQFQSSQGGAFRTIATVPLTNPHGYFDIRETLPGSGAIRTSWSYPGGPAIYSRTVIVTLH